MKLNAYLNFGGRCEAAFNFYKAHLGAEITAMMRFSDGPPEAMEHVPAEWHEQIMHANLTIDGHELMGTDGMGPDGNGCAGDDADAKGIRGAHVVLQVDEPAEADRVYAVLSEGGRIQMPMDTPFFARRFGMVEDQFGVPWMILCQ